ncbi:MAG: DUF2092 domain-containing protein [Fimbriimonadaceae bacterium]|nr:DUF2092 domain-containing protein [Fimbriimonadaceae bacterium]
MRPLLRLTVVWALAANAVQAGPTADDILRLYGEQYGSVAYKGAEWIQDRQADGQPVAVRAEVRQKTGRDYSAISRGPGPYVGAITADDGQRCVIYLPNERRAYLYPSRAAEARSRRRQEMELLRDKYDRRLLGQEQIAKRACHRIRMTPKVAGLPEVEVWIDTQQYVALRQIVTSRGKVARQSYFYHITYNPELSDEQFRVALPAGTSSITVPTGEGAQRAEPVRYQSLRDLWTKANLRAMLPRYLPTGFKADGYHLQVPFPGGLFRRRLMIKYVSGANVLMLNMGAGLLGRGSDAGSEPPTEPTAVKPGVLFWTKHDIRLLLIGPRDLASDELKKVADSVDWAEGKSGTRTGCLLEEDSGLTATLRF